MTPSYLQYAESLAADLESANQPVSAMVVRQLLREREALAYACNLGIFHCERLSTGEVQSIVRVLQDGLDAAAQEPAPSVDTSARYNHRDVAADLG